MIPACPAIVHSIVVVSRDEQVVYEDERADPHRLVTTTLKPLTAILGGSLTIEWLRQSMMPSSEKKKMMMMKLVLFLVFDRVSLCWRLSPTSQTTMTERMTPWPFGKAGGEERESEEPSFGVLMGG